MNDWNGNGRYDAADSYMDYHLTNSHSSSSVSSDWWILIVLCILMGVCPSLGVIIFFGIIIFG